MASSTSIHEGGCRCGEVRFAVRADPLVTMVCHCTGCQRMTASAFSLSALYPASAFEVKAGEPVIGGLGAKTRHFFCPRCKSWLFTRPDGADHLVNVRSPMLDEPGQAVVPLMETYASEKLAWVATPAEHSFDQFPPMEAYGALIQAYAQRRG